MSRITKPIIPPSMYKHFAIITIALTGGIALFADGENQKTLVQPVAAELDNQAKEARGQLRNQLERAPVDGGARSALGVSGFGQDVAFGQPMETVRGSGGVARPNAPASTPSALEASSYPEGYLASLSEAERKLLLAGLRDSGMLDPEKRREQIAALNRSSALRGRVAPGRN